MTDADEVPIKGATVFVGERYHEDARSTTTDSEGWFACENYLPSFGPDQAVVTVQAPRYAPELQRVPLRYDMEPVIISLAPVAAIRGRVVDVNGSPLAGVTVAADSWRGNRTLQWQSTTDADGRFVWNEAPRDAVEITFYKSGYIRRTSKFTARDEAYDIVIHPPLVISGSVTDVETGEPVRYITATRGIQWQGDNITWENPRQMRYKSEFSDGHYEMTIDNAYPGYRVRIEAEGYLPAQSRMFDSNEGTVTFDFQLERGDGLNGIVHLPSAMPAAGAEVYVVTPGRYLFFENGKLPSGMLYQCDRAETDADGHFHLTVPLTDGLYKIFVMHDEGVAEVSSQAFAREPNIILQHWGRIEGTLYDGLNVAPNQDVGFYSTESQNASDGLRYGYSVNTRTDDVGRFLLDRVLHGQGTVARKIFSEGGRRASFTQTETVDVIAGRTIT